ncbi:MAG: hypothetical protein FWC53_01245 [Firmicutes bacterium]|nr:hypothetical protein [Bacillota bacterium]
MSDDLVITLDNVGADSISARANTWICNRCFKRRFRKEKHRCNIRMRTAGNA